MTDDMTDEIVDDAAEETDVSAVDVSAVDVSVVDVTGDSAEARRGPTGPVFDVDTLPGGAAGALEAVLMVVDDPISDVALATALGLTRDRVRAELAALAASYLEQGRGFELREVGGAWRFYSAPE